MQRRDLGIVAAAVALLLTNQLSFVFALDLSTTTVALLFGTLPIFTALIARLVGVEQLGNRFWLAAALLRRRRARHGGLGRRPLGQPARQPAGRAWRRDLGWYSVAIAPLMQRYSPFRLSAIFLLAVFLALVVLGSAQLAEQEWDLGPQVWALFAFATLGPLVLTNLLWFTAIDQVGPSRAALFANLQPFLAAIIALVLLSEELTMLQVAGGFAIAAGIVFSRRSQPWRADVIEKRIGKLAARPVSAVAEVAGRGYTGQATPRHLRGRLDCLREGRGQ